MFSCFPGGSLLYSKMQLLAQSDTDGYYMTLGEDYPWGSNMTAADHGNLLLLVHTLAGEL